jgi:hypothetical protein
MQHEIDVAEGADDVPLDHSVVLRALWPSLSTNDRRALRLCFRSMRAAVDAEAGCVEEGQAESPVLSAATIARLAGTHTLTLRSMMCLRGMLPQPGTGFPHLQSLRLRLVGARHGR